MEFSDRKSDVRDFHDVPQGLAIIFGVRLLVFFFLWIAGYRPLYIVGFNRAICDVCGCGNRGGKESSEHTACGCTLGGCFSKYANDQLGALRNHDIWATFFFCLAFIVLASGLGNDHVTGSWIPPDDAWKNDGIKDYYTDESDHCARKIVWAGTKTTLSLFTDFSYMTTSATAASIAYNTGDGTFPTQAQLVTALTGLAAFNKTYVTSTGLSTLRMNQMSCINPDADRKKDAGEPTAYFHSPIFTTARLETAISTQQLPTYTQLVLTTPTTTQLAAVSKSSYATGDVWTAYECCLGHKYDTYNKGDPDADIGSVFVAYSALLLTGTILCTLSSVAYCFALAGYSIRARPLPLAQKDGSTDYSPI